MISRSRLALAGTAFAVSITAANADPIVVNFDSVDTSETGGVTGAPVLSYLASYGISFSSSYSGLTTYIQSYAVGSPYVIPVSEPNLFQVGNTSPTFFTYNLNFSTSFAAVSFTVPGLTDATMAAWSATAYSADNTVLSSVGDPSISYSGTPTATYTLDGPDIAYVQFSSNAEDFAGLNLSFDDLTLSDSLPEGSGPEASMPEPTSLLLLGSGLLGLASLRRRKAT